MGRLRRSAVLVGIGAAAVVLARRVHRDAEERGAEGGVLMPEPRAYDAHSGRLMGSLYRAVAADVAAVAPPGSRVLEVGCGPGRLAILLAFEHRLDVTALDLDGAMIEIARENAEAAAGRSGATEGRLPTFVVADVASMPFPDQSFDLVVSTLSMHHWADKWAGLAEIDRVLRPGGRALIWDFRRWVVPFHARIPDAARIASESPMRLIGATPWAWPWKLKIMQRLELVRHEGGD